MKGCGSVPLILSLLLYLFLTCRLVALLYIFFGGVYIYDYDSHVQVVLLLSFEIQFLLSLRFSL